jgi:hypothetical protein
MHHDGLGYYMYLPHVFIYHDFDFHKGEDLSGYSVVEGTTKLFDKYTYGAAVLMLPFFLISHIIVLMTGSPPTGFSKIYDMGIMVAASFYMVLGMFFLVKVLSENFRPLVVMLTLLAIYGGTNLYFYTIRDPSYSHVYSFFLFSLFIYLVPDYIRNTTWKKTFLISVIFGLIFLIRPTNSVVILYLLLYDVYNMAGLKTRWIWFRQHFMKLCLIPVAVLAWFIPQILYWHYVLGKWQFYAYRHEGFIYWNKPKIAEVLFSVQNGMFVYAPMAFFSIAGLLIGIFRKKFSSLAILLIVAISTYTFASWWCWWYGGSFGHRGYIEYFAFLSIPTAYAFSLILKLSPILRSIAMFFIIICIVYSVSMVYVYHWPWEGPNWTWQTYGHTVLQAFGLIHDR